MTREPELPGLQVKPTTSGAGGFAYGKVDVIVVAGHDANVSTYFN
jgi:hypothetical protein